jgi:hypothetical protein
MFKIFNKKKINKENSKKLKLGIDINEVLRNRWLNFDRFYADEFGEEGIPTQPYQYDLFNTYKWEDSEEINKYLNEELPDNISPFEYVVDEKTGEAPVDAFAFKKEKKLVTAKEKFNRFMYEDYLFEIHGSSPVMYKGIDLHLQEFYKKYKDIVDIHIVSKENWFTIPPTLFFLSKIMPRIKHYNLVETNEEIWDEVDILITSDPDILKSKIPEGKKLIKISRPYNTDIKLKKTIEVIQVFDLLNNKKFEKLIK